jgi:hypothetical protein
LKQPVQLAERAIDAPNVLIGRSITTKILSVVYFWRRDTRGVLKASLESCLVVRSAIDKTISGCPFICDHFSNFYSRHPAAFFLSDGANER